MNGSDPIDVVELPMLVVERGQLMLERMARARIEVNDILAAARREHGIERIDQIRYALLEAGGAISIIPCTPHLEQPPQPDFPPTEQMK